MSETPFDRGLQPERTLLAWRRTCLAFGVASGVATRLTVEWVPLLAIAVGVVGVALAGAAYVLVAWRYRRAHHALVSRGSLASGALPLAFAAASSIVVGVASASFVALKGVTS